MRLAWLNGERQQQHPLQVSDLRSVGVMYESLAPEGSAYQAMLDRFKGERGYVEQDIVELHPRTPDLASVCAKFQDEHLHTDDEVRYVLEGEGIFDIRALDDAWMRIWVEPGDLLVVPAGLHHRFWLTERKQIRCVRLFKDRAGWIPQYRHHFPGASTSDA